MNQREAIFIRKYIRDAYSMIKDDDGSGDAVWYDMLQDEDYSSVLQAVKSIIRSGNKYPPSISDILTAQESLILGFNNRVLETMEADGYFDDAEGDPETAQWNKQNRKRKAQVWVGRGYPKEAIPEWFKRDYQRYEGAAKQMYLGGANETSLIPAGK